MFRIYSFFLVIPRFPPQHRSLGGIYWISCLIVAQASSYVAVYLVSINGEHGGQVVISSEAQQFSVSTIFIVLGVASLLCFTSFTVFVSNINRGYIGTFFTTITAKQFCCQRFHEATSESAKINVFSVHSSYYFDIKGEIMEWLADNWARWEEEKPDWFVSKIISKIPLDMLPKDESTEEENRSEAEKSG